MRQRSTELIKIGLKPFDALHLASAEIAKADVMLTTDDRLLRRAFRYRNQLEILINNPLNWLLAVNQVQGDNDDAN